MAKFETVTKEEFIKIVGEQRAKRLFEVLDDIFDDVIFTIGDTTYEIKEKKS